MSSSSILSRCGRSDEQLQGICALTKHTFSGLREQTKFHSITLYTQFQADSERDLVWEMCGSKRTVRVGAHSNVISSLFFPPFDSISPISRHKYGVHSIRQGIREMPHLNPINVFGGHSNWRVRRSDAWRKKRQLEFYYKLMWGENARIQCWLVEGKNHSDRASVSRSRGEKLHFRTPISSAFTPVQCLSCVLLLHAQWSHTITTTKSNTHTHQKKPSIYRRSAVAREKKKTELNTAGKKITSIEPKVEQRENTKNVSLSAMRGRTYNYFMRRAGVADASMGSKWIVVPLSAVSKRWRALLKETDDDLVENLIF